jgi:osmotically-inducible protein OsmY
MAHPSRDWRQPAQSRNQARGSRNFEDQPGYPRGAERTDYGRSAEGIGDYGGYGDREYGDPGREYRGGGYESGDFERGFGRSDESGDRWQQGGGLRQTGREEERDYGRTERYGQQGSYGQGDDEPGRGWRGPTWSDPFQRSGRGSENYGVRGTGYGGGYGTGGSFGQGGGYSGQGQRGSQRGAQGTYGPGRSRSESEYSGGGLSSQSGGSEWSGYSERGSQQQSHRGRGPKGYQRSDERIKEAICEQLSDDPAIDASDITVTVTSGVVTLSGTVDERRAKYQVEDMIAQCGGVKDVDNKLRVQSGSLTGSSQSGSLGTQSGSEASSTRSSYTTTPGDGGSESRSGTSSTRKS